MDIINISEKFMTNAIREYPPHQKSENIEYKTYKHFYKNKLNVKSNLKYLPLQWTNYYVHNNYGKSLSELQEFYDNLPKEKYFTITQYAGGPLIDINNCIVFSSGGMFNTKLNDNLSYVPIPLLSDNHNPQLKSVEDRKYLASYIGRNTHKIREDMEDILYRQKQYYVKNLKNMSIAQKDSKTFKSIMADSIFSLCPRGFGPTSFRLYEALEFNTIPIIISDELFLPYREILNWDEFSLIIHPDNISEIPFIIEELVNKNKHYEMLDRVNYVYGKYFNFEFLYKYISEVIERF